MHSSATAFDLDWVRSQFPALHQTADGNPVAFFDGPGGTQVPQSVIDAVSDYLSRSNANLGGAYATSVRTESAIQDARLAFADLLGNNSDADAAHATLTRKATTMARLSVPNRTVDPGRRPRPLS